MRFRNLVVIGVPLVLLLAVVAAGIASQVDAGYLLLKPDRARALASVVSVQGEAADPRADGPGLYYVAVLEDRASYLERVLARFEDDVTALPDPHDEESSVERRAVSRSQMADSQRVAGAVAERALGLNVRVERDGVQVEAIDRDGPGAGAGLLPGDVIVKVNAKPVRSVDDLRAVMKSVRPGDRITLERRRLDDRRTLSLVPVADVKDAKRAIIGISAGDAGKIVLPKEVSYEIGQVGGPSAGLAFALEIYDSLSGRKVGGERRIVATGTVDIDGNVGPIGGVRQKAIGAARSGADVFVVPEQNAAEARAAAPPDLEIVSVSTFKEALADLAAGAR